jgi:phosphoheptose isomerase
MLPVESIEQKFHSVIKTDEWRQLQDLFNKHHRILVLGNGGNLAVADHAASDISRLTKKDALAPGSGIVVTALTTDENWETAMAMWVRQRYEKNVCALVLVISSSGNAKNLINAVVEATNLGADVAMISAYPTHCDVDNLVNVVLHVEYYHTAEVLSLLLMYELIHGAGFSCPDIKSKGAADLTQRVIGFKDELTNVAVDFDGVIYKNSKGFHDGTIYDDPVEGAYEGLERLSKYYNVIVWTAKARSDRGLVNGKTGAELIWEWLEKEGMSKFVSEVTAEKPRGVAYIDDKAIRFTGWKELFENENLRCRSDKD